MGSVGVMRREKHRAVGVIPYLRGGITAGHSSTGCQFPTAVRVPEVHLTACLEPGSHADGVEALSRNCIDRGAGNRIEAPALTVSTLALPLAARFSPYMVPN